MCPLALKYSYGISADYHSTATSKHFPTASTKTPNYSSSAFGLTIELCGHKKEKPGGLGRVFKRAGLPVVTGAYLYQPGRVLFGDGGAVGGHYLLHGQVGEGAFVLVRKGGLVRFQRAQRGVVFGRGAVGGGKAKVSAVVNHKEEGFFEAKPLFKFHGGEVAAVKLVGRAQQAAGAGGGVYGVGGGEHGVQVELGEGEEFFMQAQEAQLPAAGAAKAGGAAGFPEAGRRKAAARREFGFGVFKFHAYERAHGAAFFGAGYGQGGAKAALFAAGFAGEGLQVGLGENWRRAGGKRVRHFEVAVGYGVHGYAPAGGGVNGRYKAGHAGGVFGKDWRQRLRAGGLRIARVLGQQVQGQAVLFGIAGQQFVEGAGLVFGGLYVGPGGLLGVGLAGEGVGAGFARRVSGAGAGQGQRGVLRKRQKGFGL